MFKDLYRTTVKYKNHDLVKVYKSGLSDLKKKNQTMAQEENEIKKPNEMIEIVEETLEFNKQIQEGKRIKILTPDQMLSLLPVYLSQLKAANNSQQLINEIIQLLYSLYRSKKIIKTIYNYLINAI